MACRKEAKATETDTSDGYWATLEPHVKKASRDQVESLTKDLFRGLWKHADQDAAVAAAAPFWKKITENTTTIRGFRAPGYSTTTRAL